MRFLARCSRLGLTRHADCSNCTILHVCPATTVRTPTTCSPGHCIGNRATTIPLRPQPDALQTLAPTHQQQIFSVCTGFLCFGSPEDERFLNLHFKLCEGTFRIPKAPPLPHPHTPVRTPARAIPPPNPPLINTDLQRDASYEHVPR